MNIRRDLPRLGVPYEAVSLADPAQEGENEPDGELRRGLGEHVRCIRDHDSAPPRGHEVHVVRADCVVRDDTKLRTGGREIGLVDDDRRGRDDSGCATRRGLELDVTGKRLLDLGRNARGDMDARPRVLR